MKELQQWLTRQIEDRLVEPNSGLGEAITYMLKHWYELTLFLRQAGAPLDNNLCERALKKVILHRKNAMFYKTDNGAHVGDMYMSLIYTCELCGANPFDYLTELQRHAAEVAANPARTGCPGTIGRRWPSSPPPPAHPRRRRPRPTAWRRFLDLPRRGRSGRSSCQRHRASCDRHRGTPESTPLGQRQDAVFTPTNSRTTVNVARLPLHPACGRRSVPLAVPRSRPSLVHLSQRSATGSSRAFREPSCFRPRQPSPAADHCSCVHVAPGMPMSAFSATVLNRSPADRNRSRSCRRL